MIVLLVAMIRIVERCFLIAPEGQLGDRLTLRVRPLDEEPVTLVTGSVRVELHLHRVLRRKPPPLLEAGCALRRSIGCTCPSPAEPLRTHLSRDSSVMETPRSPAFSIRMAPSFCCYQLALIRVSSCGGRLATRFPVGGEADRVFCPALGERWGTRRPGPGEILIQLDGELQRPCDPGGTGCLSAGILVEMIRPALTGRIRGALGHP